MNRCAPVSVDAVRVILNQLPPSSINFRSSAPDRITNLRSQQSHHFDKVLNVGHTTLASGRHGRLKYRSGLGDVGILASDICHRRDPRDHLTAASPDPLLLLSQSCVERATYVPADRS